MDAKSRKNILLIAFTLTVMAVVILAVVALTAGSGKQAAPEWELRAHEGKVALYHNGMMQTVYEEIVLDSLPPADVSMLESGISFPSKEEAELATEDYDG